MRGSWNNNQFRVLIVIVQKGKNSFKNDHNIKIGTIDSQLGDVMSKSLHVLIAGMVLFAGLALVTGQETVEPISLVKRGGRQMVDELQMGTITGMVGWEPYPSEAILNGGKLLWKSSEIWPHHPCCVLAYDQEWYERTPDADEILRRVVASHKEAQEWVTEAKDPGSRDYEKLVAYSMEFTSRSREVCELALENIDFDYDIDSEGVLTYAESLRRYGLFNERQWKKSGYNDVGDYVDHMTDDRYLAAPRNEGVGEELIGVRFGYLTEDLHQLSFYVACKEGIFEHHGIKPALGHDPFENGVQEMREGFKMNSIDIGYLGIAPTMLLAINENDFDARSPHHNCAKVTIIAGVNYDGTALVVDPSINSMEDLAGKTVAYPGPGTVQSILVMMAAEEAGLLVKQ